MNVTVYSKASCPWCVRVKDFLHQNGIQFVEKDATEEGNRAFLVSLGCKTVPQVFVGDARIGGYEDTVDFFKERV